MTTTIELLRKEAREKVDSVWGGLAGRFSERDALARITDELVTHVHNSAIRSALDSLPETYNQRDQPYSHIPWNACRTETEKKLQSLLVNE